MLVGRTLKEMVVLLCQAVLIIRLAIPLGFRPYPAGVLAGLAMLILLGVGLGALSFVLAIKSAPSGNSFYRVTQVVMFPVLLLSGVLLPVESGPAWLRVVGRINPVSLHRRRPACPLLGRPHRPVHPVRHGGRHLPHRGAGPLAGQPGDETRRLGTDRQEQERGEQHQMHAALQRVSPAPAPR